MKKIFILILLTFITGAYAQESANRFEESTKSQFDNTSPQNEGDQMSTMAAKGGPAGPGEPVPVDNYIPLLLLTAVGVIIYKTHKKTNISSER